MERRPLPRLYTYFTDLLEELLEDAWVGLAHQERGEFRKRDAELNTCVAVVKEGAKQPEIAECFKVSLSPAERYVQQELQGGVGRRKRTYSPPVIINTCDRLVSGVPYVYENRKDTTDMTRAAPPTKTAPLTDVTPYIYGTTRLGDNQIPFDSRVEIALAAMEAGVWFHTSHTYGDALQVLRNAFDQDRSKVPKLIVKLIGNSPADIRKVVRQNLEPLGLESLELGQLCLGSEGQLADELADGDGSNEALAALKDEGLVKRFVLEVFPGTSSVALGALRSGNAQHLIDGYIFYLNPLQRFASNELWDALVERNERIIAMRTVAGGPVHRLRDVPGAAWQDYLQKRAVEVAPIFERSGVESWTEFCVRFAHSFPQVRATVGATARKENLVEFLSAVKQIEPLTQAIREELVRLHYRWSDELDDRVEPWSM